MFLKGLWRFLTLYFNAHLNAEMIFWVSLHSPGKAIEAHGRNRFSGFFFIQFWSLPPSAEAFSAIPCYFTAVRFWALTSAEQVTERLANLVTAAFVLRHPHRQTNTPQWKRFLNCLVLSIGEE